MKLLLKIHISVMNARNLYFTLFEFTCRYLDRYRDIKDIIEEVFREKMKNMKPLEIPQPAPKYPILNLKYFSKKDERPSWLKLKLKHKYLEEMQWKETDEMKN